MSDEEKMPLIPITLSIIHRYIDKDSASIIEDYLITGTSSNFFEDYVISSFEAGRIGVAELITNVDSGMSGACESGYIDIIKSIINNNLDEKFNWNNGFIGACYNGHIDIVNLMIECSNGRGLQWNVGMYGACYNNHSHITKLLTDYYLGKQNKQSISNNIKCITYEKQIKK